MATLSARAAVALLTDWRGTGSTPAYQALADRIRLLVLDGRILLGTRLPAERELAAQLGLSRTTVASAYAELREQGYLDSVRGSGSVARLPGREGAPVETETSGLIDFSKASMPALPWLPDAARWAAEQLPRYLSDPGFDGVGDLELREAIAARYRQRGVPTQPEQIMVTLGAQHAISLVARTLLGRGDRVLVESPSYPHAYEALRGAGARMVPVSVTSHEGWDDQGLEQAIRGTSPVLGYLMPEFHNPTGASMPEAQRERLVALAAQQGTLLVVDETIGELDIDRPHPLTPLAAVAPPPGLASPVISLGSVGKTVWGGMRIGWIRADRGILQRLVRARAANDLGTPLVEQLMVTHLLRDWRPVLELRRQQLRAGRETLQTLLADRLPEWTVPHVHGGLTTWVNLGEAVSSQFTIAARASGLVVIAGPRFGLDGAFERFLRIPFGYGPEQLEQGVAALERTWRGLSRHPLPDSGYLADVV